MIQSLLLLITLAVALYLPAVSPAQESEQPERWILGASTSDGTRLYYRGLKRDGAIVTFSQASVTEHGIRTFYEARVDCKKSLVSFREATAKGSDPTWTEWTDIFPGSAGEQLMEIVCKPPAPKEIKRPS